MPVKISKTRQNALLKRGKKNVKGGKMGRKFKKSLEKKTVLVLVVRDTCGHGFKVK